LAKSVIKPINTEGINITQATIYNWLVKKLFDFIDVYFTTNVKNLLQYVKQTLQIKLTL